MYEAPQRTASGAVGLAEHPAELEVQQRPVRQTGQDVVQRVVLALRSELGALAHRRHRQQQDGDQPQREVRRDDDKRGQADEQPGGRELEADVLAQVQQEAKEVVDAALGG